MGVEYRHFIVIDDASWRPESDTVERVEKVLRHWSLIDKTLDITNLTPTVEGSVRADTKSPGRGLAIVYDGVNGSAVESIAGASAYKDVSACDRYLMRSTLVVGTDYRVHWSSDGISFYVKSPPSVEGRLVAAEENEFDGCLFEVSFPSDGVTSPPVVLCEIDDFAKNSIGWNSYNGFWQAALVLDFGKDLPAFAEGIHLLPSRELIGQLSAAFRGPVIEIGEFY